MNALNRLWHRLFLEDRPSIGLSFFRICVAMTVGLHVMPSLLHLDDNYLSTAYKTLNASFFTPGVLELVHKSPDWLVIVWVWIFGVSWAAFLAGWRTQAAGIALMVSCYYFYALNAFHIGTLSWDILLVTLFLMCVTPYPGDYFSIDALRRGDPAAYRRPRPFFLQRLLQLQIASTFFYTGLYKVTAEGNWLTGNPLYALMNYPSMGVTKHFMLKEWMAVHPQACYAAGLLVVVMELALPFLLFWHKTRRSAIVAGCLFHVLLVLTLDVPTIFFFLFPAQLMLFIDPRRIVAWVEAVRGRSCRVNVLYDGDCGFCLASVARLKVMDLWGHLTYQPGPQALSELKLVEGERTWGGFFAFRRLCWYLPMLYPLLPIVYLPGAAVIGQAVYRWVARNRRLLHRASACTANHCFREPPRDRL